MDVQSLTVGPVAENCYLLREGDSDRALIVDPEPTTGGLHTVPVEDLFEGIRRAADGLHAFRRSR